MDIDADKVLVEQKIERAINPTDAGNSEYMVEGSAIGEEGLIQVVLDAHDVDGTCLVTIADGHRTGEQVSVSDRYVTAFGSDFVEDAAKRLFR